LTWLLAIARRVAAKEIRSRAEARRRRTELTDVPAEGAGIEVELMLASLPPELREALTLTRVVGLTYEEAAATIGCPVGTVRSRVFRARQRLIEAMR
jgi:RNA polymerase sigma-70 factor (ECF subfamily)